MDYQIKQCEIFGTKHPGLILKGWIDSRVKRIAICRNASVIFEQELAEGNSTVSYFNFSIPLPDIMSDYEVMIFTDHYMPFLTLPCNPVKRAMQTVRNRFVRSKTPEAPSGFDVSDKEAYQTWLSIHDIISPIEEYSYKPLISIIIPVYNVDPVYLSECLDSILAQTYQRFEICIADDCSTNENTIRTLKEYENRDSRIKVAYRTENGHISACSNTALSMASGEFAALVDDDDLLPAHALNEIVRTLNSGSNIDMIYTDEDKLGLDGRREYPHFKSDYAPDSFHSGNYICHFSVIRKDILEEIGGFREGYEGAQDFDLFLRVTRATDKIVHIPKLLYHWRMLPSSTSLKSDSKNYAADAGKRALEDYYASANADAEVSVRLNTNYFTEYKAPENSRLEIVIRYHGSDKELYSCINSLFKHTPVGFGAITITGSNIPEDEVLSRYGRRTEINVLDCIDEKAATAALNAHLRESLCDCIAFLDDRVRIHSDRWAELLKGYSLQPSIGLCAARIHDLDGTICESGIVLTPTGFLLQANMRYPRTSFGVYGRLSTVFDYSALNNKCCMVSRAALLEAGGLDEQLELRAAFYGLSMQLMENGYRNVFVPEIECTFPESDDTAVDISTVDRRYLYSKWDKYFLHDTYYNRNFSMKEPFQMQL